MIKRVRLIYSQAQVFYILAFVLIFFSRQESKAGKTELVHKDSPFAQLGLPNCTEGSYLPLPKRKNATGIVCPMIRDEIGFLSEWVAYYEMHGFTKVILFDHNSTSSLAELDPWFKTGFVEVIPMPWWTETWVFRNRKDKFMDTMFVKYKSEVICKQRAIELGIDVFLSVDIDEYAMPRDPGWRLVDELYEWFTSTTRGVTYVDKLNFNGSPHILEPINLLTIEAFQTRMLVPNRMNYYATVSQKVALHLTKGRENVTESTLSFLVYCCDFHGCGNYRYHKPCKKLYAQGEKWNIEGKHRPWKETIHIHHYARSLEKFTLKQQTWQTAGAGEDSYDVRHYLDRALGSYFDPSAVHFSCQLRDVLRLRTGEIYYIRPGDMWYRNPEFGRTVSDPKKRGRHGSGFGKVLGWEDMNPYPAQDVYQKAHKAYTPPQADSK